MATITDKRMKSIKEKADEYAKSYFFSILSQTAPNIHFEAGANYVLEQIENVLNNPYQCTFETLKANIEELVEQLKEK